MDWAQIIVVLLSLVLAAFVVVGVALTVMIVRVSHQIRSLSRSAQHIAEAAERAAFNLEGTLIKRLIQKWLKGDKK